MATNRSNPRITAAPAICWAWLYSGAWPDSGRDVIQKITNGTCHFDARLAAQARVRRLAVHGAKTALESLIDLVFERKLAVRDIDWLGAATAEWAECTGVSAGRWS